MADHKENPISKLMIGILVALAEFELSRIKERQAKERANAKKSTLMQFFRLKVLSQ
ncbi:recombinase family protein [Polaribacter sp.]|uniref:recombinase family protein n=1 Tax=Polaribacter sp. TaxID=1920175 RepID=UPI003F4BA2D2